MLLEHIEPLKIDPNEFDITLLTDKLKANNITYAQKFFKPEDPKQLFIPFNEFAYNLNKNNTISSTYWLEWIIQFDTICRTNKIPLLCETRSNISVAFEYQKDCIWVIWEAIFNEIEVKIKSNFKKNSRKFIRVIYYKIYSSFSQKKKKYFIFCNHFSYRIY